MICPSSKLASLFLLLLICWMTSWCSTYVSFKSACSAAVCENIYCFIVTAAPSREENMKQGIHYTMGRVEGGAGYDIMDTAW